MTTIGVRGKTLEALRSVAVGHSAEIREAYGIDGNRGISHDNTINFLIDFFHTAGAKKSKKT